MIQLRSADAQTFDWLIGAAPLADAPALCPGGLAPPEVMAIVIDMAAKVRAGFTGESAWMIIADDEAVGLISYKQPPMNGSADIGYGIGASREGRGHATGAVKALADHARTAGLHELTAETSIDNRASQRVLENAGFHRTGERDDEEDGRLICWALDLAVGEGE
jgi:RimJ/RimL family protein N-acetyltransferase